MLTPFFWVAICNSLLVFSRIQNWWAVRGAISLSTLWTRCLLALKSQGPGEVRSALFTASAPRVEEGAPFPGGTGRQCPPTVPGVLCPYSVGYFPDTLSLFFPWPWGAPPSKQGCERGFLSPGLARLLLHGSCGAGLRLPTVVTGRYCKLSGLPFRHSPIGVFWVISQIHLPAYPAKICSWENLSRGGVVSRVTSRDDGGKDDREAALSTLLSC